MRQRFTDRLRARVDGIWEAQHQHPFVRGIADGTLDLDRFRFWVRQDYLFLIDYSRVFALGAARAPDLATMTTFAELLLATVKTEMELHRAYAAEFGVGLDELESETKAPTTQGYTDFLLRVALHGEFRELAAALLPCMWGFSEIGQRLAEGPRPKDPRYAKWIDMYASPEFARLAEWCRDLVDRLAEGMPEPTLRRMEEAFITSSRYELRFWEMAWTIERWPA
uniref:Aminopyrimidine aminohydrolase n=1 Tax=Thermorudis sp. TaxID=1969470 RepID=A0A7C2WCU0_9BACT